MDPAAWQSCWTCNLIHILFAFLPCYMDMYSCFLSCDVNVLHNCLKCLRPKMYFQVVFYMHWSVLKAACNKSKTFGLGSLAWSMIYAFKRALEIKSTHWLGRPVFKQINATLWRRFAQFLHSPLHLRPENRSSTLGAELYRDSRKQDNSTGLQLWSNKVLLNEHLNQSN